jgi:hypothetical protein
MSMITSKTLETYICSIGGERGQGRLIPASEWEPALSGSVRALPAWAALLRCPWLDGDRPKARDGTTNASKGRRRRPCLISPASLDVVSKGGCGPNSMERKRGGGRLVAAPDPRCCQRGTEAVGRVRRTEVVRWSVNYGGDGGW